MSNSLKRIDSNGFELESNNEEFDKVYKDYLNKKIEDGLKDIKEGRVYSHKEALKRLFGDERVNLD